MARLEAVRDALNAQPFQPFDLRLVDGRSYTVSHPDFVAIPPIQHIRDIVVFTPSHYEPGSYRTHRIDLGLILEITIPSEATTRPQPPTTSDADGGP